MNDKEISALIALHHADGASLLVANHGEIRKYYGRGISDIYTLYNSDPAFLAGATVVDKVVGKGAAALMALGEIACLATEVISRPALALLQTTAIEVWYDTLTDNIINRSGTGICPVEALCAAAQTPGQCYPIITEFVNKLKK